MKVRASESKPSLLEFAERSRSSIDLNQFKYMKIMTTPEVRVISLEANDILTTSALSVGEAYTNGAHHADAPVRPAIFDQPAPAATNENSIW